MYDGVVYIENGTDIQMIFEARSGRSSKLVDSSIPMERRFAFYDQVHTTGTDIKHVPNAVACITVDLRPFSHRAVHTASS